MDPVYGPLQGPGPWPTPYFVKLRGEKSSDEREKRYSHFSGQFKLEPMTTIYVTAFNIYIDYDLYRLPFPQKTKTPSYDIKLLLSFLTGIYRAAGCCSLITFMGY